MYIARRILVSLFNDQNRPNVAKLRSETEFRSENKLVRDIRYVDIPHKMINQSNRSKQSKAS
jgi:hypothetical protein